MHPIARWCAAPLALLAALPAAAQAAPWDGMGKMIASFYNEEMSIPKGWQLSYAGTESGVEVFVFDVDADAFPQTLFLSPEAQMQRLMCGDDTLKGWIAGGMRVRADQRVRRDGKADLRKGKDLIRC